MSNAVTILDLPFVKTDPIDLKTSYWSVKPSGDWAKDCCKGNNYGRAYVQYLRENPGKFFTLPFIITAMGKIDREMGGIEVGFLSEIGRHLTDPNL